MNGLYVQLNKYQTDLYLLELSHQMTNVCLLISENLPRFEKICSNGNIKLFWPSKNQNKNNSVFLLLQIFSNLGKFSEIKKQFHVKSWLTYGSYSSVWWTLSCTNHSHFFKQGSFCAFCISIRVFHKGLKFGIATS